MWVLVALRRPAGPHPTLETGELAFARHPKTVAPSVMKAGAATSVTPTDAAAVTVAVTTPVVTPPAATPRVAPAGGRRKEMVLSAITSTSNCNISTACTNTAGTISETAVTRLRPPDT